MKYLHHQTHSNHHHHKPYPHPHHHLLDDHHDHRLPHPTIHSPYYLSTIAEIKLILM